MSIKIFEFKEGKPYYVIYRRSGLIYSQTLRYVDKGNMHNFHVIGLSMTDKLKGTPQEVKCLYNKDIIEAYMLREEQECQ